MIILVIALVVGVVWMASTPPQWLVNASAAITGSQPPADKPNLGNAVEVAHAEGKYAAKSSERSRRTAAAAPISSVMILPVLQVNVPETPKPFPTDQEIRQGTLRNAVVAAYGSPDLRLTMAESGQLVERYVYVDRPTGRMTSVAFANARVTGAQTTSN
jgi:hypothetical protein